MIYLDYSATTPCAPQVLTAMTPYFCNRFGNPSSSHAYSREARAAVEKAREHLAEFIGCSPGEIVFTSRATESNDLIFSSLLLDMNEKRRKIAVSAIEHKSVLLPAKNLGNRGFNLTLLPVTSKEIVDVDTTRELIKENNALVSVHTANNEIGTIHPINELADIAHRVGAKFHSDAAQALGKMPSDLQYVDCVLTSFSSHKIYGPKGIGALYIRGGTSNWTWDYLLYGGGQESGIRPGTHNVSAIVGFGEVAFLIKKHATNYLSKLKKIKESCLKIIQSNYLETKLIGNSNNILFGLLCFSISQIQADALSTSSSRICISHGSVCNSRSLSISHVLKSVGLNDHEAASTFRVSLSTNTTGIDLITM